MPLPSTLVSDLFEPVGADGLCRRGHRLRPNPLPGPGRPDLVHRPVELIECLDARDGSFAPRAVRNRRRHRSLPAA
jgi:hypothetical protein